MTAPDGVVHEGSKSERGGVLPFCYAIDIANGIWAIPFLVTEFRVTKRLKTPVTCFKCLRGLP